MNVWAGHERGRRHANANKAATITRRSYKNVAVTIPTKEPIEALCRIF